MSDLDKPNPFHVLRLPTTATKREIVERGQELYDTAETDEERHLYRLAKEQLLTAVHTRAEYALFEPPDTQYENVEWEQFIRKYKKNPLSPETLLEGITPIGLEAFDLPELLDLIFQEICNVPEPDINVAIHGSPFTPKIRPPLEVRDVIFG
jgi:hypothetical protein